MRFVIANASEVGGTAVGRANSKTETITISKTVLRYWKKHPVYGWNHVKRLLLHEVAHLQSPNDGHGKKWKQRAIALGAHRYWLGPTMKAKDLKGRPRPWMRGRKIPKYKYGPWEVIVQEDMFLEDGMALQKGEHWRCGCETLKGGHPSRSCDILGTRIREPE